MGAKMARNLSVAGVPLVAYDVDPDRLDLMEEYGIERVGSVPSPVSAVDTVFTSLPRAEVVTEVYLGEDGILSAAADGQLFVEKHGRGVFLHRSTGKNAVGTNTRIGGTLPLHASAAGKAIIAFLPGDRLDEMIKQQGLEEQTPHTITDEETLREELAKSATPLSRTTTRS